VFEQAFGGQMGGFQRQRGPARGRDVQVGVSLDLAEAAKGCTKEVRWRSPSAGAKSKEVQFPAGVDSGMNLKLAGQGEDGPGGSGNLYISISVQEHPIFERDGADVHVKVRLSITEAILGAKIVIPTLEGKVSLKVPAGTQSGDRRVMMGRGVPHMRASGSGTQYVHFEVLTPRKLSERQRQLLDEFSQEEEPISEDARTRRE